MKQLKSFPIILLTLTMAPIAAFAQEIALYDLGSLSKFEKWKRHISCHEIETNECAKGKKPLPRNAKIKNYTRSEMTHKDILLSKAGTLASALGDDIFDIDSLVVRGPVNDADLHTMWECSFYGGTTVINLEYAKVQDNKLPTNAFWYQSEQYTPGAAYIDCIPLRRIILPEGLQEIGEMAFSYAIALSDINLPSSLKEIKKDCFSDCISLKADPLIVPEGVEEIGYGAFLNCRSLIGNVILPSSITKIGGYAFFQSKISECNFPKGLEEIGDAAFYATRLKEAILPNTCQSLPGDSHFMLNYELEKVHFPEGIKFIPEDFVNNCIKLTEFDMPESIEEIKSEAFWQCGALHELHLSANLKSIEREGLYYCKGLETIEFPSTLMSLGAESCDNWKNIKEIYCAAPIPPKCIDSDINPGTTPFGTYGSDFINRTPQDIPVYVPVGSADLYRNAWGWNYFTNFIETDFSEIKECLSNEESGTEIIYDLFGRKVTHPIPNQIYIKNGRKVYLR